MRPVTDIQRTVAPSEVGVEFPPSGDPPTAITELAQRIPASEQSSGDVEQELRQMTRATS